jgi:hypothetical protein
VPVTVHSPQSTVHSPQSTVHSPQSTVHSPQSTVHSPQSTVHSPQSYSRISDAGRWRALSLSGTDFHGQRAVLVQYDCTRVNRSDTSQSVSQSVDCIRPSRPKRQYITSYNAALPCVGQVPEGPEVQVQLSKVQRKANINMVVKATFFCYYVPY